MSDTPKPPTASDVEAQARAAVEVRTAEVAARWAQHAALADNPPVQAKFFLRYLQHVPRPAPAPTGEHVPVDTTGEDAAMSAIAQYQEMAKINPVVASAWARRNDLFNK